MSKDWVEVDGGVLVELIGPQNHEILEERQQILREIDNILQGFEDIFSAPSALLPIRDNDHIIILKEGADLV